MRTLTRALAALSLGLALACGGGGSADYGMGGADLPQEWVDAGIDVADGNVFMVSANTTVVKYPTSKSPEDIVATWRKPFDDKGYKELYKGEAGGVYTVTMQSPEGKNYSFSVLDVMGERQLSATLPD